MTVISSLRRRFMERQVVSPAFRSALATLGPGDIALDCGANVGVYTDLMASTGASVHAFEPDPVAFGRLMTRMHGRSGVMLHNAAISSEDSSARLFFHHERESDPVTKSQSSSLLGDKPNVDDSAFVEVQTIDLSAFIQRQGCVKLMKMDVEGAEIVVLNHLLDTKAAELVEQAFVELHDRKYPALVESSDALRSRITGSGLQYDLTWH